MSIIDTMITTTKTNPVHLNPNDRIAVQIPDYRGNIHPHASNFFVNSVAAYAKENGWDVESAVQRTIDNNWALYYVCHEPTVITDGLSDYVEPDIKLSIGDFVEMDGHVFQLRSAANDNLTLDPVSDSTPVHF